MYMTAVSSATRKIRKRLREEGGGYRAFGRHECKKLQELVDKEKENLELCKKVAAFLKTEISPKS